MTFAEVLLHRENYYIMLFLTMLEKSRIFSQYRKRFLLVLLQMKGVGLLIFHNIKFVISLATQSADPADDN